MSEEIEKLKARIRELEGALRPFLATGVDWPPYVKNICVTRGEYNRAARALKGEG